MGGWISNSYVRVPSELRAEDLLQDLCAFLSPIAEFGRLTRVQYRSGDEWVRIYESGFGSLKEKDRIEALRSITQRFVDEVVMLHCYSVVSSGAYGHFLEGEFVRFIATCEDWRESHGVSEPWESELITEPAGFFDGTVHSIGRRLQLPDFGGELPHWDFDAAIAR